MKRILLAALIAVLVLSASFAAKADGEESVPFLLYHSVLKDYSVGTDALLHISEDNFIQHMQELKDAGYNVSGGVNAPDIWLEVPKGMTSWDFFEYLLEKANVVGTPGSGFGPSGEGYFRLTAFGTYENTVAAIKRIKEM